MFKDFLKSEIDKGKKLQDLADIIDVSYQTIQCYITKGNYPTVERLMKFAEHYNLSIDYLLGYKDKPEKLFSEEDLNEIPTEEKTVNSITIKNQGKIRDINIKQ